MKKANWLWRVRASGALKTASNSLGSSPWSMPFCFIFLIQSTETSSRRLCISNVIEPERGTNKYWHLFIGSDGLSAVSGRKLVLPLNDFTPLPMKFCDRCWLSRARRTSRKFGMSHNPFSPISFFKIGNVHKCVSARDLSSRQVQRQTVGTRYIII